MTGPVSAVFAIFVGIIVTAILVIVFTFIFRWLWNSTMPEVFGLKTVNFWQALKILILASILFGGPRVIERQVDADDWHRDMPARR